MNLKSSTAWQRVTDALSKLGVNASEGVGIEYGERIPGGYGRPAIILVLADDGLYRFDHTPGGSGRWQAAGSQQVEPAWRIEGRRIAWPDTSPASIIIDGGPRDDERSRIRVSVRIGEDMLPTSEDSDVELSLTFVREYDRARMRALGLPLDTVGPARREER